MNIRELTPEWRTQWDEFCAGCDEAWFWHTTGWLDWSLSYAGEHDGVSESFLVTYAKEVQGICPLILTRHGSHTELSFNGGYGSAPAVTRETEGANRRTVVDKMFQEVERIARENDVGRVALSIPPLAPGVRSSTRAHNYLRRYGYFDSTIDTRVLDLDRPLPDIRGDFRDSYDDEIRYAEDDESLSVTAFDSSSMTRDTFDAYQRLHRKDAGEQTRPQRTFDLMYEYLRNGNAVLVGAELGGEFVEFAYVFLYKGNGYYGSAASDPDVDHRNSGHLVQWRTIEWLQRNDYQFYELGHQHYGPQLGHVPSEKERNISFYKRGFGGYDVPAFRGEKFYDTDLFRETYEERLEACADHVEGDG